MDILDKFREVSEFQTEPYVTTDKDGDVDIWVSNLGSTWELYLALGPVTGIALSGVSYVVVLGAVGRVVAPERMTR